MTKQNDASPERWSSLQEPYCCYDDLEIAEESGILQMTRLVDGGPFAVIKASSQNLQPETVLERCHDMMDDLRKHNLRILFLRGYFRSPETPEPIEDYACFVPSDEVSEQEFRFIIVVLLKKFHQSKTIYSDGNEWGFLNANALFDGEEIASAFRAETLRQSWGLLNNRKYLLVEAATCAGWSYAKYAWNRKGLISGVEYGQEARQRLQGRISSRFQKATVGEQLTIGGVTFRCDDRRLWQKGNEPAFTPKGDAFHRMAFKYVRHKALLTVAKEYQTENESSG